MVGVGMGSMDMGMGDVGSMGGVGVQVCCVGVIGVGAGVDRKDLGVGGSGGVGMGVDGAGGVGVQGLDVGVGGGSVGEVGVDMGVGGVGADAGSSRRLSLSSWPSTCTMCSPTSKTPMSVLALSRALEALSYSPSAPRTDRKDPLPTYILALRSRDVVTYLLTASAFVDGPVVPEEAVCRAQMQTKASALLLGGCVRGRVKCDPRVRLPLLPWLKWD